MTEKDLPKYVECDLGTHSLFFGCRSRLPSSLRTNHSKVMVDIVGTLLAIYTSAKRQRNSACFIFLLKYCSARAYS